MEAIATVKANPHHRLFGFEVLASLGRGARSTIYAVKDEDDQVYALKHVIKRELIDQRFLDQAVADHEISSRFDHPNLRRSYRTIRHRKLIRTDEVAVLMEFVDGLSLQEGRVKDVLTVCQLCGQVALGLKAMHEAGLVHADIKPANVLVTEAGIVKVIDFGQSCEIGTIKERIQGTPDYIAPEQVHRQPITPLTDVFNLGATMYWLLTGRHIPTMIPQGEPGLVKQGSADCPPPQEINPAVPTALSRLVVDCTRHELRNRPNSMTQVFGRLELAAAQITHGL